MTEKTALIRPFTWKIIESALIDLSHWQSKGICLSVAINLSSRNLYDPALADRLPELLQQYSIPTTQVELEITESALLDDVDISTAALAKLKQAGFSLSIDDFGTGYASLAYLTDLPVDGLKIDQSFIKTLSTDPAKQKIVKAIIELAHALGLKVVAEGIEDQQAYDRLYDFGCDFGQGYLLSKPLCKLDLEQFLQQERISISRKLHG